MQIYAVFFLNFTYTQREMLATFYVVGKCFYRSVGRNGISFDTEKSIQLDGCLEQKNKQSRLDIHIYLRPIPIYCVINV